MTGAAVIRFDVSQRASRFTMADRLELQELGGLVHELEFGRMVVHERVDGDPPDLGNYLSLYLPGRSLASWSLLRRADGIVAWHCGTGRDRGRFGSIREALLALPRPRPRRGVPEAPPCAGAALRDREPGARRPGRPGFC